MVITMCASFQLKCSTVESSPEADKIQSLPGQPEVNFQQFGGYITDHDKQQQHRALYYYFVEAETNPASKPLILWLNGGPGCSSIGVGPFTEHGPFVTNYGESITKNKYSWNRARDNLAFLQRWLAKFPQYKNNEFYMMGESYGGHYVPQLAEVSVKSKMNFNLKGIGIGNPLLEYGNDYNSVDEFYWSHGMI